MYWKREKYIWEFVKYCLSLTILLSEINIRSIHSIIIFFRVFWENYNRFQSLKWKLYVFPTSEENFINMQEYIKHDSLIKVLCNKYQYLLFISSRAICKGIILKSDLFSICVESVTYVIEGRVKYVNNPPPFVWPNL